MCVNVCANMRVDICANMCIDMCTDMCAAVCVGRSVDMCMNVCICVLWQVSAHAVIGSSMVSLDRLDNVCIDMCIDTNGMLLRFAASLCITSVARSKEVPYLFFMQVLEERSTAISFAASRCPYSSICEKLDECSGICRPLGCVCAGPAGTLVRYGAVQLDIATFTPTNRLCFSRELESRQCFTH